MKELFLRWPRTCIWVACVGAIALLLAATWWCAQNLGPAVMPLTILGATLVGAIVHDIHDQRKAKP